MQTKSLLKQFLVLLFIINCSIAIAQPPPDIAPFWSVGGNTATTAPVNSRLGTMSPGNRLNIFAGGVQRISVLGTNGFVGIGNGFTNPLYRLDVDNDININWQNIGDGYRMNGVTILQTPNFGGNTYVGPFAGLNTVPPLAIGNTFVGNNAGRGNTSGNRNTCVGSNAGLNSTTGSFNTYIGTDAGRNSLGNSNTFVGEHAGACFS